MAAHPKRKANCQSAPVLQRRTTVWTVGWKLRVVRAKAVVSYLYSGHTMYLSLEASTVIAPEVIVELGNNVLKIFLGDC